MVILDRFERSSGLASSALQYMYPWSDMMINPIGIARELIERAEPRTTNAGQLAPYLVTTQVIY